LGGSADEDTLTAIWINYSLAGTNASEAEHGLCDDFRGEKLANHTQIAPNQVQDLSIFSMA